MTQAVTGTVKALGMNDSTSLSAWAKFNGAVTGSYDGPDSNAAGMFAMDLTTDFGKHAYATLLSLYISRQPVKISGNDTFIGSWEKIGGMATVDTV